jgi:hypothetical protein
VREGGDVVSGTWDFDVDKDGETIIRVDTPGERAVSAKIGNPFDMLRMIAFYEDMEYDDSDESRIVISIPPGG